MRREHMKRRILAWSLTAMMLVGTGCGRSNNGYTNTGLKRGDKDITTASSTEVSTEDANSVSGNYIEIPQMSEEEFPIIDGSTATLPLGRMIYRMSTGVSEGDADGAIQFTKTTNSYIRLMDGEADIIISYEAGSAAKERAEYAELDIRPIGLDALIFLCNTDNPVGSLSTQEIQDIYSGKITNWKETGNGDFDKEIIAFQRPDNSGSQTLMQNIMMKDVPMMEAPEQYKPTSMGDLVDSVADYVNESNSIGYSVYYYAKNMYVQPGIRFMPVDGVEPTDDTIRSGEYQYVNPFYVGIRKDTDKNSNAYKLFEWLTGEDGQSLVNQLGYVAMSDANKELRDEWKKTYAHVEIGDRKLVVAGEVFNGNSGVVVFDQDMKPEKSYADVRLSTDSIGRSYKNVIVASKNEKVEGPIEEDEEFVYREVKEGLFDIESGEWIVEPQYSYIMVDISEGLDSAVFYCCNYEDDGEKIVALGYDGSELNMEVDSDYVHSFVYKNYETEPGENSTRFQAGNDGWMEAFFDGGATLTLHGETMDIEGDYAMCLPYEGTASSTYLLPDGWVWIMPYTFDQEGYSINETNYLINGNSDIVAAWKRDNCYLELAAETYYILYEFDHYEVLNYDGELVYDWHYSNYDNDIDYRYEEYQ